MKTIMAVLTSIILLSLIAGAVGCSGGTEVLAPTTTPTPTVMAVPTVTPMPTPTATPVAPVATPPSTATATPVRATPIPTVTLTPTPASKPVVLRVSCAYPEKTPRGVQLKKFKELVEKYTNGRIQIQLFMNGVLFPAKAEWEAVQTGAVDMTFTPPFFARTVISQYNLWYIFPGIWESPEHGSDVLRDGRVPKIFADLAWEKGIKALGMYPFSMESIIISRKKEIRAYQDMKGLRFGTTAEPVPLYSKYAGGIPVPLSGNEIYIALAQGIIDAFPDSLERTVANRLYEVASYGFVHPSGYNVTMLWMNKGRWDSLPSDIQQIIVNKVVPEVQEFASGGMVEAEAQLVEVLRGQLKGLYFVAPEDDKAARDFLKDDPTYNKQINAVGPELLTIVDELRPSAKGKK